MALHACYAMCGTDVTYGGLFFWTWDAPDEARARGVLYDLVASQSTEPLPGSTAHNTSQSTEQTIVNLQRRQHID